MRVLLLTPAFPPEITGSGHLMFELAQSLSGNGHMVTVITSIPRQRLGSLKNDCRYKSKLLVKENLNGIKVIRPRVLPLPLSNPITKGFDHFSIALSYYWGGLYAGPQDVIFVYSPPLTLGLTGIALAKKNKIPLVFNAQDMFPKYAVDTGVLRNKFIIQLFKGIEEYVYRVASYITVHSDGNRTYLISRGVDESKVKVIYNWVDTKRFQLGEKQNSFREEYKLKDAFILSYAGTLGWAQGLDTIIEAAKLLREKKDIRFLIVGDGPRRRELETLIKERNLKNFMLLQLLPREKYAQMLQASDICLISLNPKITTPVVPGKLFDIMASGRPVVGNVPLGGDTPAIINTAHCGICVEPDRADRLVEAILKIYCEPSLAKEMGMNGRYQAERYFSREVCTKAYEHLLLSLLRNI